MGKIIQIGVQILILFFIHCQINSQELFNNYFNSFINKDCQYNLWISSPHSWNKYIGGETYYYTTESGIKGDYIQSNMFPDKNGNLWSSTFEYLLKYNPKIDTFQSFQIRVDGKLFQSGYHIFDSDTIHNELWLKVEDKIAIINIDSLAINHKSLIESKGRRFTISESDKGYTIFSFPWGDGLGFEKLVLDHERKLVSKEIFYDEIEKGLITRDGVFHLGNVYLASNLGLIKMSINNPEHLNFLKPKGLDAFYVNHILKIQNTLFISTDGNGLWEYNLDLETFINNYTINDGLISNSPMELFYDAEVGFYISYVRKGIQKFDYNPSVKRILPKELSKSIKRTYKYSNGMVSVANDGTVYHLKGKSRKLILIKPTFHGIYKVQDAKLIYPYLYLAGPKEYVNLNLEKTLIEKRENTIKNQFQAFDKTVINTGFITTTQEMFYLESPSTLFYCGDENYNFAIGNGEYFYALDHSNNLFKCDSVLIMKLGLIGYPIQMNFDSENRLLIGTKKTLFSIKNDQIEKIRFTNFQMQNLSGFLIDNNGNWWLTDQNYLYHSKDGTKLIRVNLHGDYNFSESPPILNDNEIILSTDEGIISVDTNIVSQQFVPHLKFKSIYINGLSLDTFLYPLDQFELILNWKENDIDILTEMVDYAPGEDQKLKYSIGNGEYRFTDNLRLSFNNLDAGNYELELIGIGNNLLESPPLYLTLKIKGPFYKTWWFLTLLASSLIGLGFGLSYSRSRRKIKAQQIIIDRQKALKAQRARMAQDLHDEMGSGLTAIQYISKEMLQNAEDEKAIQIERTSKDLIKNMRDLLWSLDEQNDNLGNLVSRIREVGSQMTDGTEITLKIISEIDPKKLISGFYRRNIILIVKEAIANVLKHARASEILISLHNVGGDLVLHITDNGIGIQSHLEKNGYGMINMKKRALKINGSFDIESNEKGTKLILSIPL